MTAHIAANADELSLAAALLDDAARTAIATRALLTDFLTALLDDALDEQSRTHPRTASVSNHIAWTLQQCNEWDQLVAAHLNARVEHHATSQRFHNAVIAAEGTV